MLPPSGHRKDNDVEYKWVVRPSESGIPTSDEMYGVVLEVLNDCLLIPKPKSDQVFEVEKEKEEEKKKDEEKKKEDSGYKEEEEEEEKNSSTGNGKSTGFELIDEDIQKITEPIQPYYTRIYILLNIIPSGILLNDNTGSSSQS
jgi:hypothetical protein